MRFAPWVLLVLLAGCYGHQPRAGVPAPAAGSIRPALLEPMTGRYTIHRGGEAIGTETFTITSSAGVWRAIGEVHLRQPAESTHGYDLQIDEATSEPVRFAVWLELYGARREARGVLEDGYFVVETTGIGGRRDKKVPYAAGTTLDFDAAIFTTLVTSLLGPTLEVKKPIAVRTVVLPLPELEPTVMLTSYELIERNDGVSRVVMSRARTGLPVALWIRADGLPIRTRTFVTAKGAPIERSLEQD